LVADDQGSIPGRDMMGFFSSPVLGPTQWVLGDSHPGDREAGT